MATDANGEYDVRDLAPGQYTVTTTFPSGLALLGPPLPPRDRQPTSRAVSLTNPLQCVQLWTQAYNDSRLTGVLLTSAGLPAADEPVVLIAAANATRTKPPVPHVVAKTGPDGRYTFAFIAAGTYLVGANLNAPPPASDLDHRAYHPGATTPATATTVTVASGSRIELTPFALPEWPLSERLQEP